MKKYKVIFVSIKTNEPYMKEFNSIPDIVKYIMRHAGQHILDDNLTRDERRILHNKFNSLIDVIVEEEV